MITIYTIPECPYCNELKEIFKNEGVEFTDINLNLPENEPIFIQLNKITESDQVPMIKVKNQILVPNKSFQSIREGADIVKKLLT